MAGIVASQLVREVGSVELLRRLSNPFWFQAFGCALGYDWHSSDITSAVCGALREATKRRINDLGIVVCGGKGVLGRKTIEQIQQACDRSGDPAESLAYASRMTAKVDSIAVQDGYELYQHCFLFVPGAGAWAVIQQGANSDARYVRRYHWFSEQMRSYVSDPHTAVACDKQVDVLNLVAGESHRHRQALTALSREHPDRILRAIRPLLKRPRALKSLNGSARSPKPPAAHSRLPGRHGPKPRDLNLAALKKILVNTHARQATEFEQLLSEPGIGAQALGVLSLAAELLYNAPASRRDPSGHGFAQGGRDDVSYRLNRRLYDVHLEWLREAINSAKVSQPDKVKSLKALAAFSARL